MKSEAAEVLALSALAHIASHETLLDRFVATAGLSVEAIRTAASDPAFLGGVLDFLMADEAALIAFCEESEIAPETPSRARALLPGAAPDW